MPRTVQRGQGLLGPRFSMRGVESGFTLPPVSSQHNNPAPIPVRPKPPNKTTIHSFLEREKKGVRVDHTTILVCMLRLVCRRSLCLSLPPYLPFQTHLLHLVHHLICVFCSVLCPRTIRGPNTQSMCFAPAPHSTMRPVKYTIV